jgi:hypothetical protein
MASRITVRHPAGAIDLGDGMQVDVTLGRQALGYLIHARVPVMAPGQCRHGGDVHDATCTRHQVGTATLITYRTEHDGSAVDLEFDIDLDQ